MDGVLQVNISFRSLAGSRLLWRLLYFTFSTHASLAFLETVIGGPLTWRCASFLIRTAPLWITDLPPPLSLSLNKGLNPIHCHWRRAFLSVRMSSICDTIHWGQCMRKMSFYQLADGWLQHRCVLPALEDNASSSVHQLHSAIDKMITEL